MSKHASRSEENGSRPKRGSRRPQEGKAKLGATGAPPSQAGHDEVRARKFAIESARLMNDLHCQDVMVLDVREKSPLTDFILIGSGTSDRQIRAVGDRVEELGRDMDMARYGRDADGPANWVVLDFVDVVVHLFEPATRGHYDLEMMWGDAPKVAWRRKAKAAGDQG